MRNIFLSRPTKVTERQSEFILNLEGRLTSAGLIPQTVGVNQFGNEAPLMTVRRLMEQCHGAVVLGLAQLRVITGIAKPGTSAERPVRSLYLPTPWNQLEAGIAFALDLPLLILHEEGVQPDGIFDPQIGDRFVHQTDLSLEWLDTDAFLQPFQQWMNDVNLH